MLRMLHQALLHASTHHSPRQCQRCLQHGGEEGTPADFSASTTLILLWAFHSQYFMQALDQQNGFVSTALAAWAHCVNLKLLVVALLPPGCLQKNSHSTRDDRSPLAAPLHAVPRHPLLTTNTLGHPVRLQF